MYCENCGSKIVEGAAFCDNCGFPVKQAEAPVDSGKEKNKKLIAIIAIAVILAVMALIIVVVSSNNDKKALENRLTGLTQKNIISFTYDDFNNDGQKEAFAVAGAGDEKQFVNSEIWYVSDNSEKLIVSDVTGRFNGILKENDYKYISYEIVNDDNVGFSYIYGVEEKGEPVESEISGKYQNVHQDGVKIVTGDGEIIGIKVPDDTSKPVEEKIDTSKFIEPTQADFEKLDTICSRWFEGGYYDYQTCTVPEAMEFIVKAPVDIMLLWDFCNDCTEHINKNDPSVADILKKFTFDYQGVGYDELLKVPADRVDVIVNEVLNLKADRNYRSENRLSCYLDGYYYWVFAGIGDYCPPHKVDSYEKLSDGRYKIKIKIEMPNDGDSYYIEVIAALKNVDGERLWSFYKISREKLIPSDAFEYNGNKYMVYIDSCKWSEAKTKCRNAGGHLIEINSEDEQKAIIDYIKKKKYSEDMWTALYYSEIYEKKGQEGWSLSDLYNKIHESPYTNWASGQPAAKTEKNGYCAMCAKDSGSMKAGQWYNASNDKELYYICEWEKD